MKLRLTLLWLRRMQSNLIDGRIVLPIADIASALISNTMPVSEGTGGNAGSMLQATGAGHQHPRLTSTTVHTVSAGSTVNITFTRTFVNKPGVICTEFEGDTAATAQPAIFKVNSWLQDANSAYTGCVIKVWRSQVVPQNLASLLLSAAYSVFSNSVVGTQFSLVAVARSDVPSN